MKLNKVHFLFSFVLFLLFVQMAYSSEQVVIEFLYWDPSTSPSWNICPQCWQKLYEEFLFKNQTLNNIQNNYPSQVLVKRIEYYSEDGQEKVHFYNITQSNSIVIKAKEDNFTIVEGTFNETYIKAVIEAYLAGVSPAPPPSPPPLIAILALAFSFGFLETFSPCLLALLSFALSFAIGETTQFRKGFLYVMLFGIGFVSAAVLLGLTVGLIFLSITALHSVLMLIVCIFAILFGLNLLGLLNMPIQTKPLIGKLAKKYVYTYAGLVVLGFLFYFLDPCIAPIFFMLLPLLFREFLPLIVVVFCLGVITPFIGIGILAGSISKLARSTYRHKSKIRAASGLILIAYSLYLILSYTL